MSVVITSATIATITIMTINATLCSATAITTSNMPQIITPK